MAHFDYIIVGAGSAGCVLAARLSEDPRNKVLLLEEGPEDNGWLFRMPKGNGKTLLSPRYTAFHPTVRETARGTETWVRGRLVGGSSSVNGMVWVRGQPHDYDRIAALGNPGWSWEDMAPCFKALEDHALGESEVRGTGGPVPVAVHPASKLGDAFIASGVGRGLRKKADLNELDQEGIGYLSMNIDRQGRRCSASRIFLRPARRRANLEVVTGVRVNRLLIENRRAVGVEGTRKNDSVRFLTDGEVILSAGALETPRLLQLSGIGSGSLLASCGVPVVLDAPGVGANLRDHFLLMLDYRLRDASLSHNKVYSGLGLVRSLAEYIVFGKGPLSTSSYTAGAFVRTSSKEVRPDGQLMFAPWTRDWETRTFGAYPGMNVFAYPLRPESSGAVMIEGVDPAKPARITPNHLATERDRDLSVLLIRYLRRLMSTPPIADLVAGEDDKTAWAQDDEAIARLFREYGAPGYHYCGTAAMGNFPGAVLDHRLRVRGIDGLRVMDLSVLPELISGNTNAPVMAMAWRAADIFLSDRNQGI